MALRFQPPPFDPSQYQYQGTAQLGQGLGQGISTAFDKIVQGLMAGRQRRREIPATMLHFAQAGVSPTQVPGMEGPGLFGEYQAFSKQMGDIAQMNREKMQAQTELTKQNAAMMARFAGGGGGALPNVVTEPSTGLQFISQPQMKGPPKFTPIPGQEMPTESRIKQTMAEDAIVNLEDIEKAIKSPDARELMLKAGGSWSKFKSLADPKAEILANAMFQAGDAEARIKTGAQINDDEMEVYFRDLVRPLGTIEGTLDRINRKKRFFKNSIKNMTAGKALPRSLGKQDLGSEGKRAPDKDPLGLFK